MTWFDIGMWVVIIAIVSLIGFFVVAIIGQAVLEDYEKFKNWRIRRKQIAKSK